MDDIGNSNRAWEKLDGIIVINLDKDTERMAVWEKEVSLHLPAGLIHRLSAVAGRELGSYGKLPWFTEKTGERAFFWGGSAGCVLSHRLAIEKARDAGWERVLIMEDDAQFATDGYEGRLAQVWKYLKEDYLLYLGCHEPGAFATCVDKSLGLWEIDGALTTHAYVLTSGLYERILKLLPTEKNVWDWVGRYKAIDLFYRDFISNMKGVRVYALLPPIMYQNQFPSSIRPEHIRKNESKTPQPHPKARHSLSGLLHALCMPLHRLHCYLNSVRTHRRALRNGLPGYGKRRH